MIERIAIEGYRSIRSLVVDLEPVTVITGANGTGKSSVYRALQLLADCAAGRVIGSLASIGGLSGVLWAGPETISAAVRDGAPAQGVTRSGPIALRLGFAHADLGYAIDLGLPPRAPGDGTMFFRDPVIKQEHVFTGLHPRPASVLVERKGQLARTRVDSEWRELSRGLRSYESVLDELGGHDAAPEIAGVRRQLRAWRFHDAIRTDATAPARASNVGTRSVRLDDDGGNVAAVLQTTIEAGHERVIARAIDDAFRGSELEISEAEGRFSLGLKQHGMLRALGAAELSDGTLQYLLLTAALTSVERPELIVLNEPERSLHADLLPALAARIRDASEESQLIVVTHSSALADELGGLRVELTKSAGETVVADREGPLDQPLWHWPQR